MQSFDGDVTDMAAYGEPGPKWAVVCLCSPSNTEYVCLGTDNVVTPNNVFSILVWQLLIFKLSGVTLSRFTHCQEKDRNVNPQTVSEKRGYSASSLLQLRRKYHPPCASIVLNRN